MFDNQYKKMVCCKKILINHLLLLLAGVEVAVGTREQLNSKLLRSSVIACEERDKVLHLV